MTDPGRKFKLTTATILLVFITSWLRIPISEAQLDAILYLVLTYVGGNVAHAFAVRLPVTKGGASNG